MKRSTPAVDPDAHVASLEGWRPRSVTSLRATFRSSATLEEVVKWGHLVCLSNGPVLLVRAEADRVLFGFWRGRRLRDIEKRQKPGGRYEMASLQLREDVSIAPRTVRRPTREAVALDAALGDPTRPGG